MSTPYDLSEISRYREEGKSWRDIAKLYDRSAGNVLRWYNRQLNKRSIQQKKTRQQQEKLREFSRASKHTSKKNYEFDTFIQNWRELDNDQLIEDFFNFRIIEMNRNPAYHTDYFRVVATRYFEAIKTHQNFIPFLPRFTGKSFLGIDFVIYCLYKLRLTVLTIASIPDNFYQEAFSFFLEKDLIERYSNTKYKIWLKWSSDSLDPHLWISGRGGRVIGSHPDIVFLEDIIQEEFNQRESNERLISWYRRVIEKMGAVIIGTGTRKAYNDFYSHLITAGFLFYTKRAIISKDGTWPTYNDLIWESWEDEYGLVNRKVIGINYDPDNFEIIDHPNKKFFNKKNLLIMRVTGLSEFESEMNQNPIITDGSVFDAADWIEIEPYEIDPRAPLYMVKDFAYGDSALADFTCTLIISIRNGYIDIVDGELRKGIRNHLQDSMKWIKKYPNLIVALHDDNFIQVNRLSMSHLPKLVRYKSINSKDNIINSLQSPYSNHIIRIFKTFNGLQEAYMQYLAWQGKASNKVHDDFLDALGMFYDRYGSKLLGTAQNIFNTGVITVSDD